MKKVFLAAALTTQLTTQLVAGGDIAPVEVNEPAVMAHHETESKFYVIAKALMILGDEVNHGEAVLDGDRDYGYGIDLGYRLGNGFAVEYDFSYARNTVTETTIHGQEDAKATYDTHALDLVYTYEMTHNFGIFAKAGYEYETEEIEEYGIDSEDDGYNFGLGVEYTVNHAYKLIAEYEHSTIEGPRGDSIFAGVMFNF